MTIDTMNLVFAKFGISPDSKEELFAGWHDPEKRWNGFACPYFTREEADRLCVYLDKESEANQDTQTVKRHRQRDGYVVHDPQYTDDDGYEDEFVPGVDITVIDPACPKCGVHDSFTQGDMSYCVCGHAFTTPVVTCYPIGSWAWCWEAWTDEEIEAEIAHRSEPCICSSCGLTKTYGDMALFRPKASLRAALDKGTRNLESLRMPEDYDPVCLPCFYNINKEPS